MSDVLQLAGSLKDRQFRHWQPPCSTKDLVRETFEAAGFTWIEMEQFLTKCFLLHAKNPLQTLRRLPVPGTNKLLDEICKVVYHEAGSKSVWIQRDALVCTWDRTLKIMYIELLTLEEFTEQQAMSRKLDRVTTIINEVSRETETVREATLEEYQDRPKARNEELESAGSTI